MVQLLMGSFLYNQKCARTVTYITGTFNRGQGAVILESSFFHGQKDWSGNGGKLILVFADSTKKTWLILSKVCESCWDLGSQVTFLSTSLWCYWISSGQRFLVDLQRQMKDAGRNCSGDVLWVRIKLVLWRWEAKLCTCRNVPVLVCLAVHSKSDGGSFMEGATNQTTGPNE